MRFGCVIFLFRSQIGRQLASLAFLASLLRVSPCLTVTFLRFWAFSAATILAWPRCTAWTGSAAAGRANAEARTAAPRPVTMFRRIVRVSSWAWVRAKESSSSCTLGWPDGTGPYVPVRHHAAARSRSRCVRGAGQEGRRGGALASGRYEPWRVEDSRRKRQGGRPVPLVGSLLVALGSSRTTGAREAGIRGDPGQTVGCPTCGEPNPRRARFCLACGDPLPAWAGRPGGTRKAVTVVVTDLSGSTALGERLDPESLSQVMAGYYEAMRAVALHHGGTVEVVGDAVHAVFGVPAAHEDDALRAVRAAAGMHAALAGRSTWPPGWSRRPARARSCSATAPGAWSATPSRSSRPRSWPFPAAGTASPPTGCWPCGRGRPAGPAGSTPRSSAGPRSCSCSAGRTSGRPARPPCT